MPIESDRHLVLSRSDSKAPDSAGWPQAGSWRTRWRCYIMNLEIEGRVRLAHAGFTSLVLLEVFLQEVHMKKIVIGTLGVLCFLLSFSGIGSAIDLHIGIGGPPSVSFASPPELVPIPGRYVYYVPDTDFDLFFYHGYWYRPYDRRWYRSYSYSGPWESVRDIPPALVDLPPDYRSVPPGYYRVPYGDVRNNWQAWERDRYWDRMGEHRGYTDRDWRRGFHPEYDRDYNRERHGYEGEGEHERHGREEHERG